MRHAGMPDRVDCGADSVSENTDRIHIVCTRPNADRILPRLARYLTVDTGWTLSERPDPKADLNYGLNYLEFSQNNRGWHETPVAAWFTHYDTANAPKAAQWDFAAAAVDLRTVTAEQYAAILRPHGPTRTVYPPVELDRFTPRAPKETKRPVVGLSGYVDREPRKGRDLVSRLAYSKLAETIELRACGRGWPAPLKTESYPWDQMPEYYRSLDVYLCTATLEGVPMPPLEAMACGVPVVIPRGVGLLDELPSVENIYRYRAGDYQDMEVALAQAVDAARRGPYGVNVESLRGVASRFTPEGWTRGHQEAFEALLHPRVDAPAPAPQWQGSAGVYLVAYRGPARECAERLIRSIRQHMPGLPVCLVSNEPLGLEDVFQSYPDLDIGARGAKTKIYDLAPQEWQYVLYLDADCEVVADISFLFQLLQDGWEAVFCTNPGKYVRLAEMSRPDNQEETAETLSLLGTGEVLQLNGGVFSFRRCEATARLMREWHREWERYGKRDQAALARALYAGPLRLYVLGNEWNTVTRYVPAERTAGILHYAMQARSWRGVINGRLDSSEAWAAVHPDRQGVPA